MEVARQQVEFELSDENQDSLERPERDVVNPLKRGLLHMWPIRGAN